MRRNTLLLVRDLSVTFRTDMGRVETVRAVDGVGFELDAGETLGLVGESGSGKTVACLAIMGLIPSPPGEVQGGAVRFRRMNILHLSEKEMRRIRGAEIAMIFQDPMTALNPLLSIDRQLTEVLQTHEGASRRAARAAAHEALEEVGIPGPERAMRAYPHELSGGMRQRVMIAMALLCKPALLIADEPTTALDVTIQAQILELMKSLQERHGTAIVLITHDLGVVAGMADRVAVMYAGKLVESSAVGPLFENPLHPYTRGLLASVPRLDVPTSKRLVTIEGQPPDLSQPAVGTDAGCAFAPRCELAHGRCRDETPLLVGVPGIGPRHRSACFEAPALVARRADEATVS